MTVPASGRIAWHSRGPPAIPVTPVTINPGWQNRIGNRRKERLAMFGVTSLLRSKPQRTGEQTAQACEMAWFQQFIALAACMISYHDRKNTRLAFAARRA